MRTKFFISLIFLFSYTSVLFAQQSASPCSDQEEFHILDFWVGTWDVYAGDKKIGTNIIEKVLGGCAIIENWRSANGGEGKSLFYYYPKEERWKQVWVTENPFSNGGVKEKAHVETLENGSTRFQGIVITSKGTEYVDRTTLILLDNGDVEQVIEISSDSGTNWREVFRGLYKPSE